MSTDNPLIKNLITLERRLTHVVNRLSRICSMYETALLSPKDLRLLRDMRKKTQSQLTALHTIILHAEHILSTHDPLPDEPGSNPIADKYRYRSQSLQTRHPNPSE